MFLSSMNQFTVSVLQVTSAWTELMQKGLFAEEFKYCMEAAQKIPKDMLYSDKKRVQHHLVEFRNVSFKYPNSEHYVLKDISLTISPQETLSIVGENGAGKSTFVKLLCRLYKPTRGDILVNNTSIYQFSEKEYSKILGVIFQDFKMFAFSVKDNIVLNHQYDLKKLKTSLRKSGLKERIETLKNDVETYVSKEFSEEGVNFSGGELQKMAIARAIYKDAPIMILDEPTSALDPIAEYELYSNFSSLIAGKNAIYISHRLTSTRFTDKIAVFKNGEIVEYGTHQELITINEGIYRKMFFEQAELYDTK